MRIVFLVPVLLSSCLVKAQEKAPEFPTVKDKVSYAIGMNVARQFKQQGLDLNVEKVALGMATILKDSDPLLTDEQIKAAFEEFETQQREAAEKLAKDNSAAAEKFLAQNAKKPGVKTTKSGLQYQVIREGTGTTPTTKNTVSTHYRGKLIDGTVFDESYKGKEPTEDDKPVSFPVTKVIKGWTEAVQLMKEGAKYRLFIKPELAYGERGPSPKIGPNSLLIFDIELLKVK